MSASTLSPDPQRVVLPTLTLSPDSESGHANLNLFASDGLVVCISCISISLHAARRAMVAPSRPAALFHPLYMTSYPQLLRVILGQPYLLLPYPARQGKGYQRTKGKIKRKYILGWAGPILLALLSQGFVPLPILVCSSPSHLCRRSTPHPCLL